METTVAFGCVDDTTCGGGGGGRVVVVLLLTAVGLYVGIVHVRS